MIAELVESAAKFLVIDSIRDESLGDLWESNYRMRQQGAPKLLRLLIFFWNFLILIKASIILYYEKIVSDIFLRIKTSYISSEEEFTERYDGILLTPNSVDQIRRYCNIRRIYESGLSKKLMDNFNIEDSYWIRQTNRIIEECESGGNRAIDCEAIVNSFILSSLIRKIEAIPPQRIDLNLLKSLIEGVNLTDEFINRYVAFSDQQFNRQLIIQTWSLAVYVISWQPGQESWMHHHGYALDAIKVIRGQMEHWFVPPDDDNELIPFEASRRGKRYEGPSETYSAGDIVLIDRRQGHQISNSSDEELVTLHFRFGYPPEDNHWRSTNDTEMFVWNQTEGCFDLIRPGRGKYAPRLW